MRTILTDLKDLGVTLCMDDFGTGYSSLSYLKHFGFDVLKVDREFTRNLVDDARDRDLTKAMIDIAEALDMKGVVAEGVETADQATALESLGCNLAQGYLFGKPVLADEAGRSAAEVLRGRPARYAATPQPPFVPAQRGNDSLSRRLG